MSGEFIRLNQLRASASGVFKAHEEQAAFNYSDGAESEQRLHDILQQAQNLSSDSNELAAQIHDWPSEYHLSPTRANLLRPLNLSGVKRVLELGCGCGAITRYLAENGDVQVDAIEGSPVRAELAAMRCRGLNNVTIASGNFNDMAFPEDYYDLVLLVGVTEYAGRYSTQSSDQAALQDLLALARRTVTAQGVVLIAIENRTGLKYMMGACEDHYGIPYVGIRNYPQSTGIRTYTADEWQSEISQAGFHASHFIFPFPDYKVPTLLVNDLASPDLLPALAKIKSRDYLQPFDLGEREKMLWAAQLEAGTLHRVANSFLLLLSDQEASLSTMADFDCAEYAQQVPAYQRAGADLPASTAAQQQQLQQHAEQLQQKLDLLTGSRGWRWLNRLRALLGRPIIR
ncbi:MAG: class I SAM-dependent methyltransferase [Arenicella sp.]|nr:class I SAM-dependent methyltransferase [Arenicella sp.]